MFLFSLRQRYGILARWQAPLVVEVEINTQAEGHRIDRIVSQRPASRGLDQYLSGIVEHYKKAHSSKFEVGKEVDHGEVPNFYLLLIDELLHSRFVVGGVVLRVIVAIEP